MLYLVPTPIGNLADMTHRAVDVLKEANVILAEDTRNSGKLLKHYSIETPMQSFHAHNEHIVLEKMMDRLTTGETIALITDAGTPGISDPGFLLVRSCVAEGVEVNCLPGAAAFVPALVGSGLPCDRFVFDGFLPHKKGRTKRLEQLKEESRTIVLYESPHRISRTIFQLSEALGDRREACIARELTKLHEEYIRGSLGELKEITASRELKGEIVIIVAGKD
jgi:16S rRNA (cytidine1402-2'-O)-methyltransferase